MQIKFILYNLNTWFTQSKKNLFDRQILQCGYLEPSKFAFQPTWRKNVQKYQ